MPLVKSITAGFYYFCAIGIEDHLLCWGNNSYGQLGSGPVMSMWGLRLVTGLPGTLDRPNTVSLATGGGGTTCAVSGGNVWCWGFNHRGQAGANPIYTVSTSTLISGVKDSDTDTIEHLTGGQYHFCVIVGPQRKVKCWGDNRFAQLGGGDSDTRQLSQVASEVVQLSNVKTIVAHIAGAHSCVIDEANQVKCWGYNDFGVLGYDQSLLLSSKILITPANPLTADAIGTGYQHVCAIHTGFSRMKCWGHNNYNQVAPVSDISVFTPLEVWLMEPI